MYLFSPNSFVVKGYNRSIVLNLHLNSYDYIPNSLHDLIQRNFIIDKWYEGVTDEEKLIIKEYVDFLHAKKYLIKCNKHTQDCFSKLNLNYQNACIVSSVNMEYNSKSSKKHVKSIVEFLKVNRVKNLSVVFKGTSSNLDLLLAGLKDTYINYLELFIQYTEFINLDLKYYVSICNALSKIVFLNSEINSHSNLDTGKLVNIFHTKTSDLNTYPNQTSLILNKPFFIEAQMHNTYYNGKLFIDEHGCVKNSLTSEYSVYVSNCIEDLKEFNKYWKVGKNKVKTCKDCEYRYMCYDTREPRQNLNEWFYEGDCDYNPYIAKWKEQEGYISVEEWRKQNPDWEEGIERFPLVKKPQKVE